MRPVYGLSDEQERWLRWYAGRADEHPEITGAVTMRALLGWLTARGERVVGTRRRGYEDSRPLFAWAARAIPGFVKRDNNLPLTRLRRLATTMFASGEPWDEIHVSTDGRFRARFVTYVGAAPGRQSDGKEAARQEAVEAVRDLVRVARSVDGGECDETEAWDVCQRAAEVCQRAARAHGRVGELRWERERLDAITGLNQARARGDQAAASDLSRTCVRLARVDVWAEGVLEAVERAAEQNDPTRQHPDAIARTAVAELLGLSEGMLR